METTLLDSGGSLSTRRQQSCVCCWIATSGGLANLRCCPNRSHAQGAGGDSGLQRPPWAGQRRCLHASTQWRRQYDHSHFLS